MLGAIGALIPEGLSMAGVELGEPVWWKVGGHAGGWVCSLDVYHLIVGERSCVRLRVQMCV